MYENSIYSFTVVDNILDVATVYNVATSNAKIGTKRINLDKINENEIKTENQHSRRDLKKKKND